MSSGAGRAGRRLLILPVAVAIVLAVPVEAARTADRDKDGLPDRWEQRHRLAVSKWSARADPDRDGLRNRGELRHRTNPRRADTDRDGLRDGAEVRRWKTNPRRADTDRDGLRDGAEVRRWKTNPRRADTDGDGLRDGAEVRRWKTDPRKRDTDGDGYYDGREVRARKSPRSPDSHPAGPPDVPTPPAEPAGPPPTPHPPPPGGDPPPPGGFPNPASTGVPNGWTPAQTRTTSLHVNQAGAVVEDLQLDNADIVVNAPNVTIRRVKLRGGRITNFPGSTCHSGMTVEDVTIEPSPGASYASDTEGVVGVGGYTARRVEIWRRAEGFRAGGSPACGPVRVEDSFAKIVIPLENGRCDDDYHSDGIQGYDGPPTTVVNSTFDSREAVCGTAPFFFPRNQGNTSVAVDRLLVMGGGYPFRLGVPGPVSGLRIVAGSWVFGPISVACSRVTAWSASIVDIDADYQVTRTLRSQPCNTEDGI